MGEYDKYKIITLKPGFNSNSRHRKNAIIQGLIISEAHGAHTPILEL